MTIPFDNEHRWWLEVSDTNPDLVNDLRNSLITFVALNKEKAAEIVGTGFVISGGSDIALAMTAKHVLTEGAKRVQRPRPKHAPSTYFVPDEALNPSIEPTSLKLFWAGAKDALGLNTVHATYNNSTDICLCLVTPQENEVSKFQPISLPIDIEMPSEGDVVHLISQGGFDAKTQSLGNERIYTISRSVSVRLGVVTGVYFKGFRQYQWPCFTTSIPAEPGMSGGAVFLAEDGKTRSACGVVCADNSSEEARTNSYVQGESIIASTLPSLAMQIPNSLSDTEPASSISLLALMKEGRMPHALGGIDRIRLNDNGNGDVEIVIASS